MMMHRRTTMTVGLERAGNAGGLLCPCVAALSTRRPETDDRIEIVTRRVQNQEHELAVLEDLARDLHEREAELEAAMQRDS